MKRRTATIALLSALMFVPLSFAADFPQRPIKIIVPFPAGGASDFLTRVVAEEMAKGLGVSVVTENRSGGGSLVATLGVLKTAPDGYTLLLVANSFLLNSRLRFRPPYDAMADFVPVSLRRWEPPSRLLTDSASKWREYSASPKCARGSQTSRWNWSAATVVTSAHSCAVRSRAPYPSPKRSASNLNKSPAATSYGRSRP